MKRAAPILLLVAACSAGAPAPRATPVPVASRMWTYEVAVGAGARELDVSVAIPEGAWGTLEVEPLADPFLRDVACSTGGAFQPLARSAAAWSLPACPAAGCRVRYRFALDEAARALDEDSLASRYDDAILSPPSVWLLHPTDPPDPQPFRLHVTAPSGTRFAIGLDPAPGGEPATYCADLADLASPPAAAFGDLRVRTVDAGGQRLEIALLPGPLDLSDDGVADWITGAARVVRDYHGRAPIAHTLLVVEPTGGHGVGFGRTNGNGGASVILPLGRQSTAAELAGGWELVHELLHVAFPYLAREHRWLAEGISTYVEPILRARRGLISEAEVWRHFLDRMALGLPVPGDQGLDHTPTWGRTYWGGALFCLMADVAIRARTEGRRSLDDALRAVVAEGGNVAERWPIERVIAVGDGATGVPVLAELYEQHACAAAPIDLAAFFGRLGVRAGAPLDDAAPLAAVRRAIVAPAIGPRG